MTFIKKSVLAHIEMQEKKDETQMNFLHKTKDEILLLNSIFRNTTQYKNLFIF